MRYGAVSAVEYLWGSFWSDGGIGYNCDVLKLIFSIWDRLDVNYERADGVCLPRCVLYTHYLELCKRRGFSPAGAATFGKVVFSSLKTFSYRKTFPVAVVFQFKNKYVDANASWPHMLLTRESGKHISITKTCTFREIQFYYQILLMARSMYIQ